jgi:hypothetical protein
VVTEKKGDNMARFNVQTWAENFKGQLRSTEKNANDARGYANGLRGEKGSEELKMAADIITKAVKEANRLLDKAMR